MGWPKKRLDFRKHEKGLECVLIQCSVSTLTYAALVLHRLGVGFHAIYRKTYHQQEGKSTEATSLLCGKISIHYCAQLFFAPHHLHGYSWWDMQSRIKQTLVCGFFLQALPDKRLLLHVARKYFCIPKLCCCATFYRELVSALLE